MLMLQACNLFCPQKSQEGSLAGTVVSACGRSRSRALGDKVTICKCCERWEAGLEVGEDFEGSLMWGRRPEAAQQADRTGWA